MADIRKGGGLRSLAPIVDQTEQFLQQKNVPKEQVVPFLMSLGRPELAGAVADRMRLDAAAERMKMMQQGQSAPPTVAQENRMQAMQMGRMMAQPQTMGRGIGAVDTGTMRNAQYAGGFAGGGPVAFQEGGGISGLQYLMQLYQQAAARGDLVTAEKIRRSIDAGREQEQARVMEATYGPIRDKLTERKSWVASLFGEEPKASQVESQAAPAPAASDVGIAAVAPKPVVPPLAAASGPAPVGFVAPDSQGPLFDEMLRSASRPDTPAAPAADSVIPPAAAARPRLAPAAPATSASGIQLPDIAKPQTLEEVARADRDALRAAGITGDATKAYEDFIKSREAAIPEERKAAYKNAWMMAGARLLGSRSPFFAQALGEAAEAGISGYQKDLKEIKAAEQAFKQASMQLAMNKEAMARGDLRASQAEVRRQEELYANRQLKLYELQEKARDSALDRATQLRIAELRNITGGDARITRLQGLYDATQEKGLTPQEKQQREDALARQLQADREFTAATTSGGYSADIRSRMDQAELLQKVRDSFTYRNAKMIADNPAREQSERDRARADMTRMEQDALRSGGGSMPSPDYAPRSQNIRNPYEGFKATLID